MSKRDAVSTGEFAVEGGTSPAYRREERSSIAPQQELASKRSGRWYEAVGGLGLEILKPGQEHGYVAGFIAAKRRRWDIMINPYQEKNQVLSSHGSLEEAKSAFLRWAGVDDGGAA